MRVKICQAQIVKGKTMERKNNNCGGCEFVKNISSVHNNFYCDNEDRIDDMGFLGEDELPDCVPEWCPLKELKCLQT